MCVDTLIEQSTSFIHTGGAARVAGTTVTTPDPTGRGNVYGCLTVINDSDQDIKVVFKSTIGYDGSFIVTTSIKGFTKNLKAGAKYDLSTIKVYSMDGASDAAGNIIFNFGS